MPNQKKTKQTTRRPHGAGYFKPTDLLDPQTPQHRVLSVMANFIYDDDALDGLTALHHLLYAGLPQKEQIALSGILRILVEVARLQQIPGEKAFFP